MFAQLLKSLFVVEVLLALGYAGFYYCLDGRSQRTIGFLPLILIAALTAISFLSPHLIVAHVAVFLAVLLAARAAKDVPPVILVAMLVLPALGTTLTLGGVQLIQYSLMSTVGLAGLTAMLLGGERRGGTRITDVAVILFIILMVAVPARDTSPTNWLRVASHALSIYWLLYYVLTRSMNSPEMGRTTLLWLGAGTCAVSSVMLFETLYAWPLYGGVYQNLGVDEYLGSVKLRGGLFRAEGPFGDATVSGYAVAIGFLALVVMRREFRGRGLYLAVSGFVLLALLVPQSRGAWLGAAVALAAAMSYGLTKRGSPITRQLAGLAAISGAAGGILSALMFSGGSGEAAYNVEYRRLLLARGIEEFWQNPLFGVSHQQLVLRMQDLRQGEGIVDFVNTYLYYALVGGVAGLLMFILPLALVLAKLWKRRGGRRTPELVRVYNCFCFSALVAVMMMLAFTSLSERQAVLLIALFAMAAVRFRVPQPIGIGVISRRDPDDALDPANPVLPHATAGR